MVVARTEAIVDMFRNFGPFEVIRNLSEIDLVIIVVKFTLMVYCLFLTVQQPLSDLALKWDRYLIPSEKSYSFD